MQITEEGVPGGYLQGARVEFTDLRTYLESRSAYTILTTMLHHIPFHVLGFRGQGLGPSHMVFQHWCAWQVGDT